MIKGKVRDVNIDQNGNIRVVTDYFDDNDNLVHANGVTRYSFAVTETLADIMVKVEADIKDHASYIIGRIHSVAKNSSEAQALKSSLVGQEYISTQGKLYTKDKVLIVDETKVISTELKP